MNWLNQTRLTVYPRLVIMVYLVEYIDGSTLPWFPSFRLGKRFFGEALLRPFNGAAGFQPGQKMV